MRPRRPAAGVARPFLVAATLAVLVLPACSSAPDVAGDQAPDPLPTAEATPRTTPEDAPPVAPGERPAYTPDEFEAVEERVFEGFGVAIEVPVGWAPVEGELGRVEGRSGFVNVTSADNDSGSLEELCANEAGHKLQPYGSSPRIEELVVAGQPGCRIWPSADQPSEGNAWGALVVRYPEPVVGPHGTYRFVLVWADQAHLGNFTRTLRFA